MFRFISCRRRRRPAQKPKTHRRIQFESLERRYCLSAPTITAFQIDSIDGRTVSVSGYVADEDPETVCVDIYDSLYGGVSPNASGYFSYSGEAYWPGTITAVAYDQEYNLSAPAEVAFSDDPPSVDSLAVTYGTGTEVTITGQVTDETPGGLPVDFYGSVYGTAVTDTSGYFSLHVPDGSASLGYVDVSVYDAWGRPAYDTTEITSDEPVIDSLGVAYGYHTEVAIAGHVTDEDPDGLTVYFSGAVEGSAVTDSNGDFTIQVADGIASLGEVTVSVSDAWGQGAYDYAMIEGDDPPEIISFTTAVSGTGLLSVEGTVLDEDPVGLTVTITFLGNEYEVTTDSNGEFAWEMQLEEGEEDWLTAIASDWWTVESEAEGDYVSYGASSS